MGQIAALHTPQLYFHYSIDTERTEDGVHPHCHNNYEIYLFVSGRGHYLIEGRHVPLRPHHLLIMRPGEFHCAQIENDAPYVRYALHFSPDMIEPEVRSLLLSPFNARPLGEGNLYVRADRRGIPALFERLATGCTLPEPARSLFAHHIVGALLAQLSCMRRPAPAPEALREAAPDVAANALEYLNTHLAEPVSLDALAARFFVSKHYLGRRFKMLTGASVLEYVIRKRVALAQQWIAEGEQPRIAAVRAGFGDYSVFFRAYKRVTGHAPKTDQPNKENA